MSQNVKEKRLVAKEVAGLGGVGVIIGIIAGVIGFASRDTTFLYPDFVLWAGVLILGLGFIFLIGGLIFYWIIYD